MAHQIKNIFDCVVWPRVDYVYLCRKLINTKSLKIQFEIFFMPFNNFLNLFKDLECYLWITSSYS
jgi:hypothetical protein